MIDNNPHVRGHQKIPLCARKSCSCPQKKDQRKVCFMKYVRLLVRHGTAWNYRMVPQGPNTFAVTIPSYENADAMLMTLIEGPEPRLVACMEPATEFAHTGIITNFTHTNGDPLMHASSGVEIFWRPRWDCSFY